MRDNFAIRVQLGSVSAHRIGAEDSVALADSVGISGMHFDKPPEKMSNRAMFKYLCDLGIRHGACGECHGCAYGDEWRQRELRGALDESKIQKWRDKR